MYGVKYVISSASDLQHIVVVERNKSLRERALCSFRPTRGWLPARDIQFELHELCVRCFRRSLGTHNR